MELLGLFEEGFLFGEGFLRPLPGSPSLIRCGEQEAPTPALLPVASAGPLPGSLGSTVHHPFVSGILISSPREKWTLVSHWVGPCPSAGFLVTVDHEWPYSGQSGPGGSGKPQGGAGRGEPRVSLHSTCWQGWPTLCAPREEAWVPAGLQFMPPAPPRSCELSWKLLWTDSHSCEQRCKFLSRETRFISY